MRSYLLSVYVLAHFAIPCLAQSIDSAELPPAERREAPITTSAAAIDQLVIGDGYAIDVEQAGVKQRFEGTLVQATDDWLVLLQVSEGRNETAVPVVSKVPVLGRFFRNVGIGRMTVYQWLPRAAVTIKERVVAAESTKHNPINIDELRQRDCSIEFAKEGITESMSGKLAALNDRDLTLVRTVGEARTRRVPVLGEIPLVGRAFTTTTVEASEQSKTIAMNDVLCIRISESDLLNDDSFAID